jgi:hypothetical protein
LFGADAELIMAESPLLRAAIRRQAEDALARVATPPGVYLLSRTGGLLSWSPRQLLAGRLSHREPAQFTFSLAAQRQKKDLRGAALHGRWPGGRSGRAQWTTLSLAATATRTAMSPPVRPHSPAAGPADHTALSDWSLRCSLRD